MFELKITPTTIPLPKKKGFKPKKVAPTIKLETCPSCKHLIVGNVCLNTSCTSSLNENR